MLFAAFLCETENFCVWLCFQLALVSITGYTGLTVVIPNNKQGQEMKEYVLVKIPKDSRTMLGDIATSLGMLKQDAADKIISEYHYSLFFDENGESKLKSKEIGMAKAVASEDVSPAEAGETRREAIVIYLDSIHEDTLNDLADEQLGAVFRAALRHGIGEDVSASLEPMSRIVFRQVRDGIDRAWENYKSICARNRKNGKKGGRPRKSVEVK